MDVRGVYEVYNGILINLNKTILQNVIFTI